MSTNPRIVHELITPDSLNTIKLSTAPSSLEGINPLQPPLPGKAIKATLFYFAQNSISAFQWGTGEPSSGNRVIPLWYQRCSREGTLQLAALRPPTSSLPVPSVRQEASQAVNMD